MMSVQRILPVSPRHAHVGEECQSRARKLRGSLEQTRCRYRVVPQVRGGGTGRSGAS